MEERDGRKLPPRFENPVDDAILDAFSWTYPYFYRSGVSANGLTVFSAVFLMASIVAVWFDRFLLAAVCHLVGYAFDVLDGNFARKYGMVSDYGDVLDHAKDLVVVVGIYAVVVLHPRIPARWKAAFVVVSLALYAVVGIHIGCQEIYFYGRHDRIPDGSKFLSRFRRMCWRKAGRANVDDTERSLSVSRWLGLGTWAYAYAVFLVMLSVVIGRRPRS